MTREDYEIHKKDYKDRNISSGAFVLIQDVYISILEAQLKQRDDEIEKLKAELSEANEIIDAYAEVQCQMTP